MQDELIAGFLSGEPGAEKVVRGWVRGVVAKWPRLLPDAEDVVQEILLEILLALRNERFAGRGSLEGYVRRIANFTCIDRIRTLRKTRQVFSDEGHTPSQEPADPRAPIDTVLTGIQIRRAQQRVLSYVWQKLGGKCRELLTLRLHESLSHKEIAARLGISETNAKVSVWRCLKEARGIALGVVGGWPSDRSCNDGDES